MLVATYHATNWLSGAGLELGRWMDINVVLSSLRMPLFFVLSGLFARKWLHADWRTLFRSKIRLFAWVFLVWETLGSLAITVGLSARGQQVNVLGTIKGLVLSPAIPRFELWFIWALIVFFIVAKATRTLDSRLQLLIAGAISAVALTLWYSSTTGLTGSAKFYFFFLAGIYLREHVTRFGGTPRVPLLVGAFALWAALSVTLAAFDLRGVFGLFFLNCVAGVFGGIVLSRALTKISFLGRIGQQTLPIYLAHTPIIILIAATAAIPFVFNAMSAITPVMPIILGPVAVTLALLLYRLCSRTWLRYLYEAPVNAFHRAINFVRR